MSPADREQFVFLGGGWTVGLAAEAALRFREASLAWTEAYYAMEYRHGPIRVAGEHTLVWLLGARRWPSPTPAAWTRTARSTSRARSFSDARAKR